MIWIKLLLIYTGYVLIFNLGTAIPAKLFGARIEQFAIWLNPWFNLFEKKFGSLTFIIGWLPLGGFVRIKGMNVEDRKPEPDDFVALSPIKRIITVLGGPFAMLIIAIGIHVALVTGSSSEIIDISLLLFITLFIALFVFGLLGAWFDSNQETSSGRDAVLFILALSLYLGVLLVFILVIDEHTSVISKIVGVLKGDYNWGDLGEYLESYLLIFASEAGLAFGIMNLLPVGGLNGFKSLETLYEVFSGKYIRDGYIVNYSIASFLVILGFLIWITVALS